MKLEFATILVYVLLYLSQPIPAHAQHSLLDKAKDARQSGPVYAFDMAYSDNKINAVARVNPSKPIGERVEVLNLEADDLDKDIRAMISAFDAAPLDEFWCADFLSLVGADAQVLSETNNATVLAFSPEPGPDDDADDRKFLAAMTAQITIDPRTAFVSAFEMRNRKPFKPAFIAKIKSFEMNVTRAPSPDGRTYLADYQVDVSGSVALRRFKEFERRVISNLVASDE